MRKVMGLVMSLCVAGAATVDLTACGDKFLRIGRSMRYGRYAAAYPASILVYSPRNSVPARVTDLAAVLKRAGHTPLVVTAPAALASAMATGAYDLVLAGLAESDDVLLMAQAAATHPDIVPVIFSGNAADEAAATRLSSCRIMLPGAHRNDALAEIDHKMELRRAAVGRTAPR